MFITSKISSFFSPTPVTPPLMPMQPTKKEGLSKAKIGLCVALGVGLVTAGAGIVAYTYSPTTCKLYNLQLKMKLQDKGWMAAPAIRERVFDNDRARGLLRGTDNLHNHHTLPVGDIIVNLARRTLPESVSHVVVEGTKYAFGYYGFIDDFIAKGLAYIKP